MRSAAKILRFPLGGVAKDGSYRDTTYPSDGSVYSTPNAVNVFGSCAFADRLRGGSRPGLKQFSGSSPSTETKGRWLWPNGEVILWPDDKEMTFRIVGDVVKAPDGSSIIDQHETFNISANKGAIPESFTSSAFYRDRMIVAKDSMWYASRTGDRGDFDYGGDSDDPTRAVAGSLAYAGRPGETITALAAIGDSHLYVATKRRIAVIAGEPTGGMTVLSDAVGIISANAWCNASGALYFIGPNGLYAVGDGSPILVSGRIPEGLKGLSSALLIYDAERKGIHIFASGADYFYDIDNKAFWPVSYPTAKRPVLGAHCLIDNVNKVIFKCADGIWRYLDDSATSDDGTALSSSVDIGPFKCGVNDDIDGLLAEMYVTMASGSSDVTIGVITAKSAEAAVSGSPSQTFTAKAGANPVVRPRQRGAWCLLRISATGRWAFESIQANTKILGRLRV